jgi:N-acetylneuraminic acid mutarotase
MGVVERFSASANSWENVPPMRFQRRFLAAAALGGKLYAVGGEDEGFVALRTVECFDVVTKSWQDLAAMPTRRRGLAAVALRGRLYAIGGGHTAMPRTSSFIGNSASTTESPRPMALGTVERFDPAANTWETLPPMPTPRMFLQAVVLHGKLYAIGGSDGAHALRTVERFDETTNCWESLPSMPTRRVFFSVAVLHG